MLPQGPGLTVIPWCRHTVPNLSAKCGAMSMCANKTAAVVPPFQETQLAQSMSANSHVMKHLDAHNAESMGHTHTHTHCATKCTSQLCARATPSSWKLAQLTKLTAVQHTSLRVGPVDAVAQMAWLGSRRCLAWVFLEFTFVGFVVALRWLLRSHLPHGSLCIGQFGCRSTWAAP